MPNGIGEWIVVVSAVVAWTVAFKMYFGWKMSWEDDERE